MSTCPAVGKKVRRWLTCSRASRSGMRRAGPLGQVHEAVLVVEGGVARVLEGPAAVGARRLGEDQPGVGQHPVDLVEEGGPLG